MEEPKARQINGEEEGDEFYEKIEAPKFVDFTAPDQYRPDDRYWFCLRVGCDQKHEEEMNSEAIYKDFVLRVMAARSPNIRLRKALNRKAASANVKCPLTAPPKSSKSRIPRLALISSISQKLVDTELKARPAPKLSATPNLKAKQSSEVAKKAYTTPRNRKRLSYPKAFRSVRNPKATTIALPTNRAVAKALVFNSPKKRVKAKTSSELQTPVKTLCAAMKELEITSRKKPEVGCNKSLPIDTSRKQFRGREVKSRVYDCLHSQNRKVQEAKDSRCMKRKNNNNDIKPSCDHVPCSGDDSSDMDLDEKSRDGSFEGCCLPGASQSGEGNGQEECLETDKSQKGEHSEEDLSDTSRGDVISLSSSGERDSGENHVPNSQAPGGSAEGNTSEGSDQEEKIISSPGKGKDDEVKENALACDDTENDNEPIDNDEKENALASDGNRVKNHNYSRHERIILGEHETAKKSQKVNQVMGKTLKEGSISVATGVQGVKSRKPKPTNPKPFRLRTDERGILKEANLEKKLLAPLTEIATTAPRLPGRNSQRKHQKASHKNEKLHGKVENECDTHEGGERKLERTLLEDRSMRTASTFLKASKGESDKKLSQMTLDRRKVATHQNPNLVRVTSPMEHEKTAQKLQKSLKKIKSPMTQQKFGKPRGDISSRKQKVSLMTTGKIRVIKENPPKISTPKEDAKPCENAPPPGTKTSTHTAPKSLSRGRRRPTTIPKEPIFHSIHVPKSCTRKLA